LAYNVRFSYLKFKLEGEGIAVLRFEIGDVHRENILPLVLWNNVLWRMDPLLSGDSVNSDRFWATVE
jgi:hypothetical protein